MNYSTSSVHSSLFFFFSVCAGFESTRSFRFYVKGGRENIVNYATDASNLYCAILVIYTLQLPFRKYWSSFVSSSDETPKEKKKKKTDRKRKDGASEKETTVLSS